MSNFACFSFPSGTFDSFPIQVPLYFYWKFDYISWTWIHFFCQLHKYFLQNWDSDSHFEVEILIGSKRKKHKNSKKCKTDKSDEFMQKYFHVFSSISGVINFWHDKFSIWNKNSSKQSMIEPQWQKMFTTKFTWIDFSCRSKQDMWKVKPLVIDRSGSAYIKQRVWKKVLFTEPNHTEQNKKNTWMLTNLKVFSIGT